MAPADTSAPPRAQDASPGTIATLRDGDPLAGIYACTRKDRLTARTGTPYLAVELRDRSGTLQARLFRDADLHGAKFERGDLVKVTGGRFHGLMREFRDVAVSDDLVIGFRGGVSVLCGVEVVRQK